MKTFRKVLKYLSYFIIIFIAGMIINAFRIYAFSDQYFDSKSDVAIVLGAGTKNGIVSAVFRERINHGINLFKTEKVDYIIFTGGLGKNQKESDSKIAKKYAILNGIPEDKILIEEKSTITFTNLKYSKIIIDSLNLTSVLIVSDPLHMKRSIAMTKKLKINSKPSPTPTSMYKSKSTKFRSLIYESFFYNLGVIQGYI